MSCGVLVVTPDPPAEAPFAAGEDDATNAVRPGQGIADLLRSAGHSVVECDSPQDDGSARGVVEAAWVVLAGVDLVVIVEDEAESGHPTGPLCDRARELMLDRGPGGAIVWVPPWVPEVTAAACLLEFADSAEAHGPTADGLVAAARPLEVEPVRPRPAGPVAVSRVPAGGAGRRRRAVPEGFRGGRS